MERVTRPASRARRSPVRPSPPTVELARIEQEMPELVRHRELFEAVAELEFSYPAERFAGRGIVICGGGRYFPCVYVLVRLLRHLGCGLPIEVWHLGPGEMSPGMRGLLAPHGAECVDALALRRVWPARRLAGWELKCYALLHSHFAEVLLLDADNCPVRDPSFLFSTPAYQEAGAIFWPDCWPWVPEDSVWRASGISYREEWQFESGQMVVDKARCWQALQLAMHLNEYRDWRYRIIHGDKDTFHLAWRKIGQSYAMPGKPVGRLEGTMLQYDFAGRLLFQHRNFAKWTLEQNRRIQGFRLEEECLGFLEELRAQWRPSRPPGVRQWESAKADAVLRKLAAELCGQRWDYLRVGIGARPLVFLPDGCLGEGGAMCERWWHLRWMRREAGASAREGHARQRDPSAAVLCVSEEQGATFRARRNGDGSWYGSWLAFEKGAVVLRPAVHRVVERGARPNAVGEGRVNGVQNGCSSDHEGR